MSSDDSSRYFPISAEIESSPFLFKDSTDLVKAAFALSRRCWQYYENGPKAPRYGTLYCGALGPCVFLRLRLASVDQSEETTLLEKAFEAATHALRQSERHRERLTLLECCRTGALVMLCSVLTALGRHSEASDAAVGILQLGQVACECLDNSECEVLYGRAGYLQALVMVRSVLSEPSFGKDVAMELICTIIQTGQQTAKKYNSPIPLLWEWHETPYLGAAHGVTGIVFTLLHFLPEVIAVGEKLQIDAVSLIQLSIDRIDRYCCMNSGNLRSSIYQERDRLVHWCHGAPGHVLLLTKASVVFHEQRYLQRAEELCRNVIYPRGLLKKGMGLCHGISGNAYCFLAVYRAKILLAEQQRQNIDHDIEEWLRMAKIYANVSLQKLSQLEGIPDRPYSMYEGLAGLATLMLDLCEPQHAKFPCYGD